MAVTPSSRGLEGRRSLSQAAGFMMLSGTSTRALKDWEGAADLANRGRRFEARVSRARRRGTWSSSGAEDNGVYGRMGKCGPMVRGELHDAVEGYGGASIGAISTWHDERIQAALKRLDRKGAGEVTLTDLRKSFVHIGLPLDDRTFASYRDRLLPETQTDMVTAADFLRFHKVVWGNQPAAVRRFVGDPSADPMYMKPAVITDVPISPSSFKTSQSAFPQMPGRSPQAKNSSQLLDRPGSTGGLSKSSSCPAGSFLKEVRSNEDVLRLAFNTYAQGKQRLSKKEMPAVFKALGLDCDASSGTSEGKWFGEFCDSQFDIADADEDGFVTFHEFVNYHNKFIVQLEGRREYDQQ